MNRMRWLLLALGMVAMGSVGFIACGDDEQFGCEDNTDCSAGDICVDGTCASTCVDADDCADGWACSATCAGEDSAICFLPCEDDDECGDGEVCDTAYCGGAGRCIVGGGGDGCTDNDECDPGFVCNIASGDCVLAGGSCVEDTDCGQGEICDENNNCVEGPTTCTSDAECYELDGNQYCAAGDPNECLDISCGLQPFNSCERCTSGPNSGSKADGAPLIFAASQSGACVPESDLCGEGAKLFCTFKFFFFDPDGDFTPKGGASSNVFVISGSGTPSATFRANPLTGDPNGDAEMGACFPTDAQTVGTAIFVRDAAGNDSNTLCLSGTRNGT